MNLNQVTVPVTDLGRAVTFYRLLGLKPIVLGTNDYYARFECPGGSTFSLHVVEDIGADRDLTVYFENEEMDKEVARLKAAGVDFESGPEDMPWGWREARLRDPDGNRLCLYWAGENRRFPPWRLKDGA
jgi:catechol 2,3-dioxygenase-like lactoylglutathione lyase family enzyme